MNPNTGATYFSLNEARNAGESMDDLVFFAGSDEAVTLAATTMRLGVAERERRAKRRAQQKRSRKMNR